MTTLEILDRLQGDALKDGELRKKLLATRLDEVTFFTEKLLRILSLMWDSHIPHIIPSIFNVICCII